MKALKKVVALMLCLVMTAGIFAVSGITVDDIKKIFKAEAAITLGTITQERVVANYASTYSGYEKDFLNGFSEATNIVIPGLTSASNYTPQGMTYWEAKNWILISAYDDNALSTGRPSCIYAIDVSSGNFVALFYIYNSDGTVNTSHGGGIAASEHNFYYADSGSKISYVPLSLMDVPAGTVKNITLMDSIDLKGELNSASTSYCCYNDGVLWTGNFYIKDHNDYGQPANAEHENMLLGYRLQGDNSSEEWYYLKGHVLANVYSTAQQSVPVGGKTMTYTTTTSNNGQYINISGNIADNGTGGATPGEITTNFGYARLVEGEEYVLEFTTDNTTTEFFLFSPTSAHMNSLCNTTTITQENGLYHYTITFKAGLNPGGGNCVWPSTQSTDGSYTGNYIIRFDQNDPATTKNFNITNMRIVPKDLYDTERSGKHMQGNPTYCIALPDGNDCDKVQYAMVDNGRIYISRSWSRTESTNHIRELAIAEIDLSVPGTTSMTINGVTRNEYKIDSLTKFSGSKMFFMGEALCVIDGYLYMFAESAAYYYYGDGSKGGDGGSSCPQPIDVIWKIDQYGLMGDTRSYTSTKTATAYERVYDLSEINGSDEYMIVYESQVKDPATGNNILYALDAFGGFDSEKLPKQLQGATQSSTGDSLGVVGNSITNYSIDETYLYLRDPSDDAQSLRWKIIGANTGALRLQNYTNYFIKYKNLYFDNRLFYMTTGSHGNLNNIKISQVNRGEFNIYNQGTEKYYLWCNDGSDLNDINTYTNTYKAAGDSYSYSGLSEIPGTFHSDGAYTGNGSGNLTGKNVGEKAILHIYKRITAEVSSSGHSNLYTDLNAYLTEDGTYTVELEAYATGSTQKSVGDSGKPVDFIFVLDASASMTKNSDCYYFTKNNGGLTHTGGNGKWILHNGRYYQLENHTSYPKRWLSFTDINGTEWYTTTDGTVTTTKTTYGSYTNLNPTCYRGDYYERGGRERLQTMKDSVNKFVDKINEDAGKYNVDHRISIIQFGSNAAESYYNTGMYTTTNGTSMTNYSSVSAATYESTFYESNHPYVKNIISGITSPSDKDADTYVNYGFEMAYKTLQASGQDYSENGNRSACIVMFTDGVPGIGSSGNNYLTEAQNSANGAISYSKQCKDMNATVYTIQLGNNSADGFDMNAYMSYVSSNYPSATSISNGGASVSSAYYTRADFDGSLQTGDVLDGIFNSINETIINTGTAITLNGNSILRQTFGDKYITTNARTTVQTARIYYDALGRIAEDAPKSASGVTATTTGTDVQVKGFNYSDKYVTEEHEGEKLIVKIEGLLIDPNAINTQADVSKPSHTAIYKDNTDLGNNAIFRDFPQAAFSIPEYTYVLDYGVDMVDIDINGTMKSIDTSPKAQTTYKTNLNGTKSNIAINQQNALVYSVTPNSGTLNGKGMTSGYVLIQRDSGAYDWFKINVVPASNVLFEETSATISGNGADWAGSGTAINTSQTVSTKNDTYGYDALYGTSNDKFSNGTVYQATVSNSNKTSKKATFQFTGKGFDLVSGCGTNTGIQVITVKKHENSTTKIDKVYIVDTYFNDSYGTLRQVPIVHHEGGYATYTVETTAAYLTNAGALTQSVSTQTIDGTEIEATHAAIDTVTAADLLAQVGMEELANADVELVWMDDNSILNGGTGAVGETISTQSGETVTSLINYLDGYRIYNPVVDDSTYISNETQANYYNVMDSIETNEFGGDSLVAFVEGGLDENAELSFSNYRANGGPKSEVYLEKGDAVTFRFDVVAKTNPKAMVSLRAASGTPSVKINAFEAPLQVATEMYYDVTDYLTYIANEDGSITCIAVIVNNGDGLLAVDNIKTVNAPLKVTSASDITEVAEIMYTASVLSDMSVLNAHEVESKYPDYVLDPTVRPEDLETPDDETPVEVTDESCMLISFFRTIASYIVKFFDIIKNLIFTL